MKVKVRYIPEHLVRTHQLGGESDDMDFDQDEVMYKKGGHWIQNAVNPAHKGYCTPMTKSTCTPKRKAFAITMKKHHGFHQQGGIVEGDYENNFDNPFFQMGGTPQEQRAINRAVPEKKFFGNAKKSGVKFQMGSEVPKFKNPQQFHDYYGKQLGYKLVPGASTEYYNPNQYTPSSTTDRLAPWTSQGNAPLTSGNYPQQTFGYDSSAAPMAFKQSSPTIDTSKNPYQQVGFGANPAYIDKRTGQAVPTNVVMQQRQSQISAVPTQKFGGDGGAFLKSLVKSAYKDVMKKGGESAPQGMTGDEVLQNRNNTFRNYLSNNAMKAIAFEEIQNLQDLHNYMKCGGMYQQGGEPENSDAYWNTLPGYNGGAEMGTASAGNGVVNMAVPQFYPPVQNDGQQPITSFLSSDQLAGQPTVQPQRSMYDLMSNDIQNSNFQQPQQNQMGSNWFQRNRGPQMAEGIIAGLNFGTAALNQKNTRANENLLKQRMSADNVFVANQFGNANRGQYDTNSGVFKPNQYTFSQNQGNMKMGGEHEGEWMTEAEIKKLKKAGYTIQYLD